jgi:hypothetical protein
MIGADAHREKTGEIFGLAQPVDALCGQQCIEQFFIFADDDGVAPNVKADHVPRRGVRQAETASLADGVAKKTAVLPDLFAIGRQDRPLAIRYPLVQPAAESLY